jgi:hypothetical protein
VPAVGKSNKERKEERTEERKKEKEKKSAILRIRQQKHTLDVDRHINLSVLHNLN